MYRTSHKKGRLAAASIIVTGFRGRISPDCRY
jgi:hypothetical protein